MLPIKLYGKTKSHQKYFNLQHKKVPGCTTVIEQLGWNKRTLMGWVKKECDAGNDPFKKADKAADIGTCAHWMVQCLLEGYEPDLSEFAPAVVAQADRARGSFIKWIQEVNFLPIGTEVQLVNPAYDYGCTIDIVGMVNGKFSIVEIKTSAAIYPENWVQVASQAHALQNGLLYCFKDSHITPTTFPDCHIIRLGKDSAEFQWETKDNLSSHWAIFLNCLSLYYLQKEIKGGKKK